MSELRWTSNRHQLLNAVAVDRRFEYDPPQGSKPGAFGYRGDSLSSLAKRVLTELLRAGLIQTNNNRDWSLGDDVDLSNEGRSTLARWNTEHGEVTT